MRLPESDDPGELSRQLLMQGNYELRNQIDSSHKFLYGHRFWPDVKKAVETSAANFKEAVPLADQILNVAREVAATAKVRRVADDWNHCSRLHDYPTGRPGCLPERPGRECCSTRNSQRSRRSRS